MEPIIASKKTGQSGTVETAGNFVVHGQIVDQKTGKLAAVFVRAFDRDGVLYTPLGETQSDQNGLYRIEFSEAAYKNTSAERGGPELFVRVFDQNGNQLGQSTHVNSAGRITELNVVINNTVHYRVHGTVCDSYGKPVRNMNVQAFDRDLRNEQLLGETKTNRDGSYEITYSAEQFRRAEKDSADLLVKAFSPDGILLAATDVLFNAPPIATVDLVVSAEAGELQTLFEKIRTAIAPLLEELKAEELEEDEHHQDVSFLSGETGFEKINIVRFALANRLARADLQAEFWFAMLGASFFEYNGRQSMNEHLTSVRASLPRLDARAVRKALTSSFNKREIPAPLKDKAEKWITGFLKLVAHIALGDETSPTFARMALNQAGIDSVDKQAKFARLFNEHKTLTPELLAALGKDKSFKKAEIADLRTSYQLADLTRGDFSVVNVLKNEFKLREPGQIRSLAKQSESQWVELIKRKHKAGEINVPFTIGEQAGSAQLPEAEIFGKHLERQFREAFPTAAFAGGLERALGNGGAHGLRHAKELGRLLDRHPEFELLRTPVDEFLENGIRGELRGMSRNEEFRREVKAVQRVFKVAPTFEATVALLKDGVHSAQMAYRMGESEFVRRYSKHPGFSGDSARQAWNRAADTHAAVLTVIGDLAEFDSGILPGVLKSSHPDLSKFPNWNNLFQSGDICHCEPCRSVLSPAAYYADILMFLKDRKAKNPALTVKELLFNRRPDLGYIELNCENANTTLPYVDVVCEVLERAVDAAGDNDLILTGFTALPGGSAAAKTAVSNAFNAAFVDPANAGKEKVAIGDDFSLSQVNSANPNLWVVHGVDATYLLKKKGGADFFAELLPNTKAGSEELRAYPAHVNPKAYARLRQARFPFGLPFDLFAEEVRAAFQKCNLQRWDLMRTLHGTGLPNNPTDGDIAAEYFGISCEAAATFDEKRLILQAAATVPGQQAVWGETGNAVWLATLANVKTFLFKTGLEYGELQALLDLRFINPAGDLVIQHLDSSCDTDKKTIQGLNPAKLDRIHRFLRMWRKLAGWKMWELDLAIRSAGVGGGALNEPFLVNLYYFCRLRTRLGEKTTVVQLCGLFDNLSTDTYYTKLHEKRTDGFYQGLFLNKKLIQPLDPAFEIAAVDVAGPTAEKISGHIPVILSALGVRETDFDILAGLTRATNGAAYITDDLTLANLSFLWRHAWLARLLKFKTDEWKTVLKVLQQDVVRFSDPKVALEFVEDVDHLKATGFTPDELSWLLTADRTAKGATKETDATRFLSTLRAGLQAIRAEYDPARYEYLEPPADPDRLTALLTSLLQQLNRDEPGAQFFINILRDEITQEKAVPGLPAGFTFPAAITDPPPASNIRVRYEPVLNFNGSMTAAQRTVLLNDPSLAAVTGLVSYQKAVQQLFEGAGSAPVPDLPAGFAFPATITGAPHNIPIHYYPAVRFSGLMTSAQQTKLLNDPSLAAVTGIAAYQQAINDFFVRPRLALKFLDPVFSAALRNLPAAVDFKTLSDPALTLKIAYDAEERVLRVAGILSVEEKDALDVLSADLAYRTAVNSLFTQPRTGVFLPEKLWLKDTDLKFPLRDRVNPANDNLMDNLAKAVRKALAHLSRTVTEGMVVQQASAQLQLSEGLTRRLVSDYAILPESLLAHLTGSFAATTGVVDYLTIKTTFDGWFWATRIAALWNKWKLTRTEWERIRGLTAVAQLLDFAVVPRDNAVWAALPPVTRRLNMDRFLATGRLIRLRDSVPETGISLLEVLEKLNGGQYLAASDFADDVQLLNEAWSAVNVESLIGSLDLAYPNDYLRAGNWERLRRAFYFVDSLNAGVDTVKTFAAATMTEDNAKTLKQLLRSKFGSDTWLTLSTEIQDALRERKRDALAGYLLANVTPANPPSLKWENTNDLYAYYLLDVEMSSCQLTSRLVQASGSVQLFVQRCFMGLEPEVLVKADGTDGDSAWRWWKWMRKYRVWEANRKVFLWPENWIEPELKKDRSSFFRDLENELLQNEIDQDTAEKAFANYLEKLDGVAQLEIAGFYHEDDGDNTIIHTFGRTKGAEPHLYYYRRYDYRQWTPWEKVDLDIQGDYLVPAVVNKRLFLFWPVFTEVPDEAKNSGNVPIPASGAADAPVAKTWKKLKLQMAVSDYRQGKWTPKRVSKQYRESSPYDVEIARKFYAFYPVDRSSIDGRFGIKYSGYSADGQDTLVAYLSGAFEITGCNGVPELANFGGLFQHALRPEHESTGPYTAYHKWLELEQRLDSPDNDFSLESRLLNLANGNSVTQVLLQTPGLFQISPPWHLSYLDTLMYDGLLAFGLNFGKDLGVPLGSWLPFFYNDKKRTFFVVPSLWAGLRDGNVEIGGELRSYYPDVKREFRTANDFFEGLVRSWVTSFVLPVSGSAERGQWEEFLSDQLPGELVPPFTDEEVRELLVRFYMRYFHFFMGMFSLVLFQFRQFHFKNFYHPFVCDFAKLVHNPLQGIPGLMKRETQLRNSGFSFKKSYVPTLWVVEQPTDPNEIDAYPKEVVDFSPDGAYSSYNWELFFHAPLMIANALSKNQRFEEARDWYHFIFNPIGVESAIPGGSDKSKYWITRPFFETTDPQYVQQRIENIMRMLAGDASVPGYSAAAKKALEGQVYDWRTNPFEPHRIANYRTVAYQKTAVMKYLDNLIAWGDYLFRQDSMESINEATQLYILAAEILGQRPKKIPQQAKTPLESFNELEKQFDAFSNALVEVENYVPQQSGTGGNGTEAPPLPMLYFCIPLNEKMLGYWDTVADRLYKIRHCMNIEGVVRQLALFEPPIDPGALVKAVAGGVDIGAALADLNAPLPVYRFNLLLQKANEVCNDVKSLGSGLLSALEKKDAEALSLLRQGQEIRLLEAVKAVREKQIEEAKENLEGAKKSRITAETRRNYYRDIARLSAQEQLHLDKLDESQRLQEAAQGVKLAASIISIFPAIDIGASGFGGSPLAKFKIGGLELGQAASLASDVLAFLAQIAANDAAMASSKAVFDRRWDDWKLQERLADRELDQLDQQIASAELRVAIAERELENHVTQIDNAKSTDAFMRSKYTNEELYQWQVGQISGVYFQSYKLAYDLAKRAERCYRFELGLQDSSIISFGYWDSLKKGLLSGEKLQYDLRRLESAYLEQNRREFELTKHISLTILDPIALIKLRETGRCFLQLPEEIFDLDYPGHYFRRIKSVSLTLPCVAGPYTTISCTLRLLTNSIRINTSNGASGYPRNTDDQGMPADDSRFVENSIPVKAIAASSGQNDSGVFELSFRDERYLPFEGAGVISGWSLELFNDNNPDFGKPLRQFDYATISDAILHIKYTAREDAGLFKNGAITHLREHFSEDGATPSLQVLHLRRDFASEWSRFLKPSNPASGNVFEFEMSPELFPFRDAGKTLKINRMYLLARCTDDGDYGVTLTPPLPAPPPAGANTMALAKSSTYGGLHFGKKDVADAAIEIVPTSLPVTWKFKVTRPGGGNLQEDPVKRVMEVEDLILVVGYEWE